VVNYLDLLQLCNAPSSLGFIYIVTVIGVAESVGGAIQPPEVCERTGQMQDRIFTIFLGKDSESIRYLLKEMLWIIRGLFLSTLSSLWRHRAWR
jgi:hypothetical protein